jgi:hypothetical protein
MVWGSTMRRGAQKEEERGMKGRREIGGERVSGVLERSSQRETVKEVVPPYHSLRGSETLSCTWTGILIVS